VFSAGTLGRPITMVRRSMEQRGNKAKTVSWNQREHSLLQIWTWLVAASWHSHEPSGN